MTDFFQTVPTKQKRVADVKQYTVDAKPYLRSYWIAGRRYAQNDIVRPPSTSGFAFQAQNAGEAGSTEPPWARILGGTTQDASITWLAIAPGNNAVDVINGTPVWSQVNPPDGALVINGVTSTIEESTATISGGTAGVTYRINVAITTLAGNVYNVPFDLEVG